MNIDVDAVWDAAQKLCKNPECFDVCETCWAAAYDEIKSSTTPEQPPATHD